MAGGAGERGKDLTGGNDSLQDSNWIEKRHEEIGHVNKLIRNIEKIIRLVFNVVSGTDNLKFSPGGQKRGWRQGSESAMCKW